MSAWIKYLGRWIRTSGLFFWFLQDSKNHPNGDRRHRLGASGERLAEEFLKKLGYKILARGYRSRLGEIDLIAVDGNCIVFVEVKTWNQATTADPSAAVDLEKQGKITRTALSYLKQHRLFNRSARFDVVAIVIPTNSEAEAVIRHYKSAFEAVGQGQLFR
ncbi:MAG: YraN family protein [Pirellulales bacterium]